jgi:hypothetical protein
MTSAKFHFRPTDLNTWRASFLVNTSWRPSLENRKASHPALSDAADRALLVRRTRFVSLSRPLDFARLQPLILMLMQDLGANEVLDQSIQSFKRSRQFMASFLSGSSSSYRLRRSPGRPNIDDSACAAFLNELTGGFRTFSPSQIVNFDESNWHPVMRLDQVAAGKGNNATKGHSNGDTRRISLSSAPSERPAQSCR